MNLYHYTKFETAIKYILPHRYRWLKFNNIGKMNDPIENMLHCTNLGDSIFENESFSKFEKARKFQKEWKIMSFSTDRRINDEQLQGCLLPKMWAHYGSGNEGVCLVINYEKFKKENEELIKDLDIIDNEVKYNNYTIRTLPNNPIGMSVDENKEPKAVDILDVGKNSFGDIGVRDMFFIKHSDWESESEYRFIMHSKSNEAVYLSIKDSLESIVLGLGFSKHYLPAVFKLVPADKVFGVTIDILGKMRRKKVEENLKK